MFAWFSLLVIVSKQWLKDWKPLFSTQFSLWGSEVGRGPWGSGRQRTGKSQQPPLSWYQVPKVTLRQNALRLRAAGSACPTSIVPGVILRKIRTLPCCFRKRTGLVLCDKITTRSSTPSLLCLSHLITDCTLTIPSGWQWWHCLSLSLQHWVTVSPVHVIIPLSGNMKKVFFFLITMRFGQSDIDRARLFSLGWKESDLLWRKSLLFLL